MKLRNLLYATMIACAFASCSNDDDPIDNGGGQGTPVAKDEAVLVVNMAGVQTKAVVNINGTNENVINSSKVVVFNGIGDDAEVEAVGEVNQNEGTTNKITLTPGNKMVVVLANYKDNVALTTKYSVLKAKIIDFASFEGVDGYLTMNSAVYTVSLAAGKINYLGYTTPETVPATAEYLKDAKEKPVYLYHNVAKVVLNKVEVDKSKVESQYPNPQLDVKEVFILHAHKNSNLFTEAAWGSTNITNNYLNSIGTKEAYTTWVGKVTTDNKVFNYLTNTGSYAQDGYSTKTYTNLSLGWSTGIANGAIGAGEQLDATWGTDNQTVFYTYENMDIASTEIYTLLVVKGDFSYDGYKEGVATRMKDENRYYSVAVGITGFDKGYSIPGGVDGLIASLRTPNAGSNYQGVIRNLQYNVKMTVKGPGYTTPFGPKGGDDTFLLVNAKVVEFGSVDQDVDFE